MAIIARVAVVTEAVVVAVAAAKAVADVIVVGISGRRTILRNLRYVT